MHKKICLHALIIVSLISCKNFNSKKPVKDDYMFVKDTLVGKTVRIPDNYMLELNKNEKQILIYFDGNCSACISEVIFWIKEWSMNALDKKNPCYIISRSNDLFEIEYHLEKLNIKLGEEQVLLADPKDYFLKENPFLDTYKNILLVDSSGNIIVSNNPFMYDNIKEVYRSHNLLE